MRKAFKYFVGLAYKPFLEKYLSKPRWFKQPGLRIEITPGVFHPGFFFSTRLLLSYLKSLPLENKSLLELGAGSGLISIWAAKHKARVTASDISDIAIIYLEKNSRLNKTSINIIKSDLFAKLPVQTFDVIVINPPFYKKNANTDAEYAWYCGLNGEYFKKLFSQLGDYIHRHSKVLMILSEDCDFGMITTYAASHHFRMEKKLTKRVKWEYLYIYEICSTVKK